MNHKLFVDGILLNIALFVCVCFFSRSVRLSGSHSTEGLTTVMSRCERKLKEETDSVFIIAYEWIMKQFVSVGRERTDCGDVTSARARVRVPCPYVCVCARAREDFFLETFQY